MTPERYSSIDWFESFAKLSFSLFIKSFGLWPEERWNWQTYSKILKLERISQLQSYAILFNT